MGFRQRLVLLAIPLLLATSHVPALTQPQETVRLVVQNGTYSSLVVSVTDAAGRETRLGQAPPEFANTLSVPFNVAAQPVRFVARMVGEDQILYRSEPVRLVARQRVRWRLPQNVVDG